MSNQIYVLLQIKSNQISSKIIVKVKDDPPKILIMIKLRRKNLSSKKNEFKVAAYPGSATEDILDYIKSVVRKKPH